MQIKTEELAEKAYDAIKQTAAPDNEAENFHELPNAVKYNFLEIAGKGGDSTPFGQAVAEILSGDEGENRDDEAQEKTNRKSAAASGNSSGKQNRRRSR